MNIALILAGGIDPKFPNNIPKQFINVNNRPLIIYTLEMFQNHSEIDEIMISCLTGWQGMISAYAKQFNISKLKYIVEGGNTGQESVKNGVTHLSERSKKDDDIIVLHDAIRPLVTSEVISDSIRVCKKNGLGIAAVPSRETIMKTFDGKIGTERISRFEIMRIQTPQSFQLGKLIDIQDRANKKGIENCWEMSSVVSEIGDKIYFSKGSDTNMKISSVEDIELFKVLKQKLKKNQEVV